MTNVDQHCTSKQCQSVLNNSPRDSRFTRNQKLLIDKSLDCVVAIRGDYATWPTGYRRYLEGQNAVVPKAGDMSRSSFPQKKWTWPAR